MKKYVLIVDDVDINRDILAEMLEDQFEPIEAEDGEQAISIIQEHKDEIAVILLDLLMPKLDGYGVLAWLKNQDYMDRLPVLVISGEMSQESEKRCFDYGVTDFIHKPFVRELVIKRVSNMAALFRYKNGLEDTVAEQTSLLRKQNEELLKKTRQLQESTIRIIETLGTVVESRNLESGMHIQRVREYTAILATQVMHDCPEYQLSPDEIEVMTTVSPLHDLGKIAISDAILLKPGKLTPEEFDIMKTHTTLGCEVLDRINGIWDEHYDKVCYEICRYHHERYDGRGYPDGLKGEDIPIAAQITGIADVYDALVSERCYKKPFPKDVAFQMIQEGKCGTFSEKLLNCFAKVREAFETQADMR